MYISVLHTSVYIPTLCIYIQHTYIHCVHTLHNLHIHYTILHTTGIWDAYDEYIEGLLHKTQCITLSHVC